MLKKYFKIALLTILALFFAFFYVKSGEPDVFDAKLVTKNSERDIKYPFKDLGLEEGEKYLIAFCLPVGRVYEIKIYEPVQDVEAHHSGITGKLRRFSEPDAKIQEYILDNLEHSAINNKINSRYVFCYLTHSGENIPLTIQIADYGGIHSYGFGVFLVTIILLVIVALKLWEKDFGKNSIWITRIIFFGLVCYCFSEFCSLLLYEFAGALHPCDGATFFAMGRAIANGLKYYTDIYEIKPPGFYFLAAMVVKLFDSPNPMHALQALVFFGIAAFPVLAYFNFSKEKNEWTLFASILLGMLLALYSGDRAGEVMIESFGACVGIVAVFFMASPKFEQRKRIYIPIIALGMLGSCGMKEPFFFAILASSFLFANNFKTWCLKFLLPLIIACTLGVIILFATGIFDGYLGYLTFMSTTHTNSHGSPLERMLQVWRLLFCLNNFAQGFGFFFIVAFIALAINSERKFQLLWKLPLGVVLTTLAVGAGGEWYDHHYVFAIPFYSAICFLWIKSPQKKNLAANILACAIFATLIFSVFNLPKNDWEYKLQNNLEFQKPAKLEALYLDEIMYKTKIERYASITYVCSPNSFGFTKHSPWGHAMIWDSRSWERMGMHVLDTYIDEINKSQIVSFQNISGWPSPYRERAIKILEEEFTTTPWEEIADIPQPQGLKSIILFRKR
jgi:hypothetical protein